MKQRGKITLGIIAGIAVVLLIILLSPVGKVILAGGIGEEQPFDAVQWKAVKAEVPGKKRIRLLMLDDLMENRLKTGMDSTVIKEMLGEPDRQYGFAYGLGEIAPGIDPMYVVFTFNVAGKYEKMDIVPEKKLIESRTDESSE